MKAAVKKLTRGQRAVWEKCCDAIGECARSVVTRERNGELLKLLYALYSVRHGLPLGPRPSAAQDALGERLCQTVTAMEAPGYSFGDIAPLHAFLKEVPERDLEAVYPFLMDNVFLRSRELRLHSVVCPPRYFGRTVAGAVARTGSRTVLNRWAGVGALGWTLPSGVSYRADEPSPLLGLIGEVAADAFGTPVAGPYEWIEGEIPDAVVSVLPVNYCFAEVNWWEHCHTSYGRIQQDFLEAAASGALAKRMAAGVFHYSVCCNYSCQEVRKALFEAGHVETVVTFPDSSAYNILTDANVVTSLVIFDFTRKHDTVRFIDAGKVIAANPSYWHSVFSDDYDLVDMADGGNSALVPLQRVRETDYAFNAYIHVQDVELKEGQRLVRLSDIAEMVTPERYQDYEGLIADHHDLAFDQRTACTPIPLREGEVSCGFPVSGETILFRVAEDWRVSARIARGDGVYYVEDPTTVIRAKQSVVLPEYLLSILLSDRCLRRYLSHICEYYVDGFRRSHLMNRLVPIYTDLEEQRKCVELFIPKEPAQLVFSAVYVGSEGGGHVTEELQGKGVRIVATYDTVAGVEERLKSSSDGRDIGSSVDLVIADPLCRSGEEQEEQYDGLDRLISLEEKYGIPVYLLSGIPSETVVRDSGIKKRRLAYFFEGNRFFSRDEVGPMAGAIRSEMGGSVSELAVLRNRFSAFFEAAAWYEREWGTPVSETVSPYLLQLDGDIRPFNDIRILTESVIRTLQGLGVLPKELDPGAVPRFIYDGMYEDRSGGNRIYHLAVPDLMPKFLSAALVTIYDAGRPGSHDIIQDPNMGRVVINAFMALLEWFHSNRDRFSSGVYGYYDVQDPDETEFIFEGEYRGVVSCEIIGGKRYYYTGEFHLQVDRTNPQVKEGDTVVITRAKREQKVCKAGVTKYVGRNNYRKEG